MMPSSRGLLIVLVGSCIGGCGEMTKSKVRIPPTLPAHSARRVELPGARVVHHVQATTDANDKDYLTPDDRNDDGEVVGYGRKADSTERHAVVNVVRSYFHAASADDGATICDLLIPRQAAKMANEFGRGSPSYMSGDSCAEVIVKFYRHDHVRLSKEAAGFTVTDVRVDGDTAYALLAFATIAERRYLSFERQRGVWKMSRGIIDAIYP